MVGFEILVKIKPEKRFEFLQTFELMHICVDKKSDFVGQVLFEKISEPNCFLWTEDWKTGESLEAYRQTDQYRALLGAIEVLGALINIRTFTLKEE